MIFRLRLAYRVVRHHFSSLISPIGTMILFVFVRLIVWAGQALDLVLYPQLRQVEIQSPIVIVGNPRTGSTFLQRFLHQQGIGVGQSVLQQLYPSIVLQRVLQPLTPILERLSPARHHSSVAHQTSLSSIETDDAGLFLRFFDGFFLYGFLLTWADEDWIDLIDPHQRSTSSRDFNWWEKSWKRNLLLHRQERVLLKSFSLMATLPVFQERYPDAKCIVLLRDPLEMIPSALSLVSGVLEQRFQISRLDTDIRQRFYLRLRSALIALLEKFVLQWDSGDIEKASVMLVPYPRLMSDFEQLMQEILAFVGSPSSDLLDKEIGAVAMRQRQYRSAHHYSLEQFGVDEKQLKAETHFFYRFMERECGG